MSDLKLTHLEVQGFRQFRERFVLDLTGPSGDPLDYLVLAGPNGTGKTTLLQAILFALGHDDLLFRDEHPTSPKHISFEAGVTLRADLIDVRTREMFVCERNESGLTLRTRLSASAREESVLPLPVDTWPAVPSLQVEYFSSRRLPALVGPIDVGLRGRPPEDIERNRIWRLKHRIRQQQGRRVPGVSGPEPLDEVWLAALNRLWAQFRGDGSELRMTLVNPDDLDVNEWDLFVFKGTQRVCPVDALSSGELEVLSMIAPFITEPFDGLLLIDEPELHLHPQWQGRMIRALRSVLPTSQIVVATHADDPWDDAMSWERRLLVPKDDPRADGARP